MSILSSQELRPRDVRKQLQHHLLRNKYKKLGNKLTTMLCKTSNTHTSANLVLCSFLRVIFLSHPRGVWGMHGISIAHAMPLSSDIPVGSWHVTCGFHPWTYLQEKGTCIIFSRICSYFSLDGTTLHFWQILHCTEYVLIMNFIFLDSTCKLFSPWTFL